MKFKFKPDTGKLNASETKKTPNSPDYWGDIAIDMNNMQNVRVEDGLHIFRISGWKKQDMNGRVFLSLSVNRMESQEAKQAKYNQLQKPRPAARDDMNDDIPF